MKGVEMIFLFKAMFLHQTEKYFYYSPIYRFIFYLIDII